MKLFRATLLLLSLLCLSQLSTLNSQPASTNHVLELDGNGSYVELPANLLANLQEVTVEGWMNWKSFQNSSRFFDFGGGPFQINVQNRSTTSTLWFETPEGNNYRAVSLPDLLHTNEWVHIAAVRSAAGLQLVVNGFLLPTVPQSTPVDTVQGKENLLGRSNFRTRYDDADFQGRMAEVRIWSQARTEAQIRTNLAAKLTGKEPGLLALYNFADPARAGRDATGPPLRLDAQFSVEPKGATRSLQLHEVGGIGEPFNLSLPARSVALDPLPEPLPIAFTVLEEKFLGRTVHVGRLVAVSASEAGIESALPLAPLSNLKIELAPVAGANPSGEIYAKVIGAVTGAASQTRIRFTSVSPELKGWVQQATAQLACAKILI